MTDSDLFAPISGVRMSGEIIRQFIPLIREGKLRSGDQLPGERELAETFGVSRVTVRDALRSLEVMGLVEIKVGAHGGAFVAVPTARIVGENLTNALFTRNFAFEDLTEARVVLELAVFDLAAQRITADDISDLKVLCKESREGFENNNYDRELAIQFHARLAACARSEVMSLLAESFGGPLSMAAVRARERRTDAERRTVEEHEAIVEHLESGNIEGARETLRSHLLRGERHAATR